MFPRNAGAWAVVHIPTTAHGSHLTTAVTHPPSGNLYRPKPHINMAQIYVRDDFYEPPNSDLMQLRGNPEKRKIHDIIPILAGIGPQYITADSFRELPRGYIVTYHTEKDVNFIFTPDNIDKLDSQGLTVELANPSKELREAYIGNVPSSIHSKSEAELIAGIEQNNNRYQDTLS